MEKWFSIIEFAVLLEEVSTKCFYDHTTFNGGYHFRGGDVWDDCGANLDTYTCPQTSNSCEE